MDTLRKAQVAAKHLASVAESAYLTIQFQRLSRRQLAISYRTVTIPLDVKAIRVCPFGGRKLINAIVAKAVQDNSGPDLIVWPISFSVEETAPNRTWR